MFELDYVFQHFWIHATAFVAFESVICRDLVLDLLEQKMFWSSGFNPAMRGGVHIQTSFCIRLDHRCCLNTQIVHGEFRFLQVTGHAGFHD